MISFQKLDICFSPEYEKKSLFSLFICAFVLKILLLPLTHVVDCDAVSRIFIAVQWLKNPHWITSGIWVPFHFYLNGIALWFYHDLILTPKLVNILFSCLSIFPFYYFVKREFNPNGAFFCCILLVISPVLFRNSFHALSETPFLFFCVLSLNLLSKGMHSKQLIWSALGGLSMTIAAGFRYEAWLLIALLSMVIFLRKEWSHLIIFIPIALLFPFMWMYHIYSETGHLFHPEAPILTINKSLSNEEINLESWLRRGWYFPLSWVLCIGPLTAFFIVKYIVRIIKQRTKQKVTFFWLIPLVIMFVIFLFKSFNGTLLLQHRFTGTLVVFSIPFFSFFTNENFRFKTKLFFLIIITTAGLSFGYNTSGISIIPRLQDKNATNILNIIKQNIKKNTGFIVDFDGWENTWFYALMSDIEPDNILINNSTKGIDQIEKEAKELFNKNTEVLIFLKKGSPMEDLFLKSLHSQYKYDKVFEDNSVVMLKTFNKQSDINSDINIK